MISGAPLLGSVLTSFFTDHLKLQRGLRPNSITSYADAMRLFLQFTAATSKKKITQLGFDDLGADVVSQFLTSLEERRGNTAQSRNQRLAALRTFFEYVGQRFPERLGHAQKVATIPRKRTQPPETIFLERDEIEGALARVPAEGRHALRDRTLLLFLYNTGSRVQEAADVRASDVHFDPSPRVHLHGKGDKWRVCPLWKETATLLNQLLTERSVAGPPDRPVFTGTTEAALTRFGIYKIIRRYTSQVVKKGSDGRSRAVSPHVWRHSTAVHLLEAGVEVNVIRAWLGHTSLETTNRYAEITPHQAGRPGKVRHPGGPRREDSKKTCLADGCRLTELATVPLMLCGAGRHDPLESGFSGWAGHITEAGTLHGQPLLWQLGVSTFSGVQSPRLPYVFIPISCRSPFRTTTVKPIGLSSEH